MPIPLPSLDDRSYDDLAEELRALIPQFAPAWTDHNPSDPGIMLVELFAWLAEAIIYRLNRIPETSELRFLQLLDPETFKVHLPKIENARESDLREAALAEAFIQATRKIHMRWRAVTAEDFESIAKQQPGVERAKCLAEIDLTRCDGDFVRAGHVSVIIVDSQNTEDMQTSAALWKKLEEVLDERRLINTRLHVVEPRYVSVAVEAEVVLEPRTRFDLVRQAIVDRLEAGFAPGQWEFGRAVTSSEVYQWIDGTPGVDYVNKLRLLGRPFLFCTALPAAKPSRETHNPIADPYEVRQLHAGELPDVLDHALRKRAKELPPKETCQITYGEKRRRWTLAYTGLSNTHTYEISWNSRLSGEGGLFDVYGPFAPARRTEGKDGIEQIELPIDGLVFFERDPASITRLVQPS